MKLKLTMTGADEFTPISDILALAGQGVEIALLLTHDPEGRNRYPSPKWIASIADLLPGMCALHVCGGRARAQLLAGNLFWLTRKFSRIQVNGTLSLFDMATLCNLMPTQTIITQHTPSNGHLRMIEESNHALLVDRSSGRGILPPDWARPETDKPVGFAGGLGPATLAGQLPLIAAVADAHSWIDMEQKLRDESDRFSMPLALDVVKQWQEWNAKEIAS